MKIIRTKNFPFGRYQTINLFGFLFTKDPHLDNKEINHEGIHTEQMQEMLYLGFYFWYLIEFIVKFLLCFNWHRAYWSLAYEQEAYYNDQNLAYLNERKHYAWFKYIFKMPKKHP